MTRRPHDDAAASGPGDEVPELDEPGPDGFLESLLAHTDPGQEEPWVADDPGSSAAEDRRTWRHPGAPRLRRTRTRPDPPSGQPGWLAPEVRARLTVVTPPPGLPRQRRTGILGEGDDHGRPDVSHVAEAVDHMDHADHADLTLASSDPPGRFRPSRRVPVAAAAVLVVLVALAVLGVLVTREGSTPGSVDADSQPASFAPPAAVAADEELVRSRILASGDIRVDHWLSSTRPLTRVVLPPASTGGAAATVDRVRVQTSRGVLQGPSAVGARPRAYALEGAKQVHVSYVLTGAVTRSGPGDRALASPTSLDLDYPGDRVPRIVVLLGGRLLSAACSADPTVAPRPCGQAEGTSWRVRLEPRERGDVVTAQLDLG